MSTGKSNLMDKQSFHQRAAEDMSALYANTEHPPDGWLETLAWHWEQAGCYAEALDSSLEVTQGYVAELSFTEARRWVEHVLSLLDRLDSLERRAYEMRAYSLAIVVLEFGGQYREALGYARLLLRLSEENANIEAQARSYLFIGRIQREIGKLTAAESELIQALNLAERYQLSELEAEARMHLAKVHQLQGRHLAAFQQLELAQDLSTDNRARLARVNTGIGDVYRVLGAGREALALYHRALKLEIGSSNWLGQAMLYEKLSLSHLELNQLGEALECMREALRLREELNDEVGKARSYTILGIIQSRRENYAHALEHFEHARKLEEGLQNQRGMIIALTNMGDTASLQGNNEQAQASFMEALTLARNLNDQIALARMHQRLGDLLSSEGKPEAAFPHWTEALRIREALGHFEEANVLRSRIAQ